MLTMLQNIVKEEKLFTNGLHNCNSVAFLFLAKTDFKIDLN